MTAARLVSIILYTIRVEFKIYLPKLLRLLSMVVLTARN